MMTRPRHGGLAAAGLSIPVAIAMGELTGRATAALAVLAIAVTLGWRSSPGFLRVTARAAIAGAISGLLVLGPGFRLAMRVVAILDPATSPEFSVGGTAFLIVGFGGVVGLATGVFATLVARGLGLSRVAFVLLASAPILAMLVLDSELSTELFELGAGGWMNVPMFAGVAVAHGVVVARWSESPAGHVEGSFEPAGSSVVA